MTLHQQLPDSGAAGAAYVLAARSGMTDAQQLRDAVTASPDLLIDGSSCDLIGMATVQVILAAAREHPSLRLKLSQKVTDQLRPLGVLDILPPAPDGAAA